MVSFPPCVKGKSQAILRLSGIVGRLRVKGGKTWAIPGGPPVKIALDAWRNPDIL
jgi:hypothetical protein